MFTQTKFRNGYRLKFLSTILFAALFLVGGFFVANKAFAITGEGTATINGGANVTVAKSISNVFTVVLTVGASGITANAENPTFTIPGGFTPPNATPVANAGLVATDGNWSVTGGATCLVDSPSVGLTATVGQVVTVDVTAACTVGPGGTITLTYKGTSNTAMGATPLNIGVNDAISYSPVTPISTPPTITVTDIQATPTFSPVAGAITFGTTVTISSASADAIYYTTDGSDPTTGSTLYTTPVAINSALTLKVLAVRTGYENSAIGSAVYTQVSSACTSVCYVDAVNGNDTNDGVTTGTAKKTIQSAITQVSVGGTVNVAAGTYVEQVLVNKDLTLSGTGNPIIKSPASPTGYTMTESSATFEPVVFAFGGTLTGSAISGAGQVTVNISGITVDGNARIPSPTSRRAVGILYRNVVGGITDSTVQNMGHSTNSLASWGILTYGTLDATIHGNTVSGYGTAGIGITGVALPGIEHVVIDGNTVTGTTSIFSGGTNGIQVSYGSTGHVTNNTVTLNHHNTGNNSAGILIVSAPGVIVDGNTVTNNDLGIVVQGLETIVNGFSYSTNTIIQNNTIMGNLQQGISIDRRSVDTSVLNNTITGNNNGIMVGNVTTVNRIPPTGTVIHNNIISGSTPGYGLFVYTNVAQAVDATNNWWGNASPVFASIISGSVTYDPYYINAGMTTTNTDLATVKTTAHGALTTALGTYTEGNYSGANWITLNGFKTTGDSAITAATSIGDVTTAKNTATTAMAGVVKLTTTPVGSRRRIITPDITTVSTSTEVANSTSITSTTTSTTTKNIASSTKNATSTEASSTPLIVTIVKNIVPIVVNILTAKPPLSGIVSTPVVVPSIVENPPLFDVTSQPVPPTPQNRTPFIIIAIGAWILIASLVLFIVRRITSYLLMMKAKKDMRNAKIKKNENIH